MIYCPKENASGSFDKRLVFLKTSVSKNHEFIIKQFLQKLSDYSILYVYNFKKCKNYAFFKCKRTRRLLQSLVISIAVAFCTAKVRVANPLMLFVFLEIVLVLAMYKCRVKIFSLCDFEGTGGSAFAF